MISVDILGEHPFRQVRAVLADGRRLMGVEYGMPGERPPVVYFHGFLGSRLEPRVAGELPLHLLAFDRPGYGGSSANSRPSLRGVAQDVVSVLDQLGIQEVGAMGMSAGGPYAAALAVELGPRVLRLAMVGAVATKKLIRQGGGAVQLFHPLRRRGRLMLRLAPGLLKHVRRHGLERTLIGLLLRGERNLLAPGIDRHQLVCALVASVREGTRAGLAGAIADMEVLTRRWDFGPRQITCPTLIRHGGLDRVVPVDHASWYGERISRALLEIEPRAAHVSIAVNGIDRLARWFEDGA